MGTVGREIVGPAAEEIIAELNRGIAAEINDAYRYLLLSKLAEGVHSAEVAEFFALTSQDEWAHVGTLLERVISLGGRPLSSPGEAPDASYVPYKEPPKDPGDLKTMLADSLEGEQAAIRFYKQLFDKTKDVDPITAEIARQSLADEISDEDDLERFLRGWAHQF
ncbi:MAG: ferritin [Actinomycetota bacterium]|nr:ferritin [Actinomycetota bacterium]